MFGPLDNTKDLSLLQGGHQHLLLLLFTNPDFHVTHRAALPDFLLFFLRVGQLSPLQDDTYSDPTQYVAGGMSR